MKRKVWRGINNSKINFWKIFFKISCGHHHFKWNCLLIISFLSLHIKVLKWSYWKINSLHFILEMIYMKYKISRKLFIFFILILLCTEWDGSRKHTVVFQKNIYMQFLYYEIKRYVECILKIDSSRHYFYYSVHKNIKI